MHADQATQVDGVLGEGVATGQRHPAEHPLGRGETFRLALAGRQEVPEHLQEIGALQRHGDGLDAQADALEPLDVDAAGDLLGEGGQAFLHGGDPRRGQRQAGQVGLLAAVERGQRVHQGFVVEQLATVVVAELGTGAQADAGGAGGGLGDQIRIQFDRHHPVAEEPVQVALQLQRQRGGRDRHLFLRRQQFVVQLPGDLDEVAGRLAGDRRLPGQRLARVPVQRDRFGAGSGRAKRLQQACGPIPAVHRFAQVGTQGVLRIGGGGDGGQLGAGVAEIQLRVVHHRQGRLAAPPLLQEPCLHRGRPAGQVQQPDPAHGLDQARIERGVAGELGRRARHRRGYFSSRRLRSALFCTRASDFCASRVARRSAAPATSSRSLR